MSRYTIYRGTVPSIKYLMMLWTNFTWVMKQLPDGAESMTLFNFFYCITKALIIDSVSDTDRSA